MSEHKKDRTLAKPSGKRFKSVGELMAGLDMPAEVVQEAQKNADARQLTLKLSLMRLNAGVTQAEMAKRLDITQGAVSKLENGFDDDVTVKHLRAYAEATKMNVGFAVGRPPNHVEAIKLHAMGIRNHMKELAKLAHNDEDMERGIQEFFGEAFFNILSFLSECQQDMPNGNEIQMRIEVVDSAKAFAPAALLAKPAKTDKAAQRRMAALA